ncbi:hypothetical protein ACMAZE_18300 [Pseudopelagicola sp. nBUS_20]|uniref:hypothetical protein n=1 Tax=Pseudopelagicola sp. nBUS_20 TaxID=3395317 RepID=UPI003EBBCF4E
MLTFKSISFFLRTYVAVAVAVLTLSSSLLFAQTPLESLGPRQVNFETGQTLPARTLMLKAGTHQTIGSGSGTGSQLYYWGLDYAVTDDFQLGFSSQVIEDTLEKPILNLRPPTRFYDFGVNAKYRFVNTPRLQVAAQVSLEMLQFRTATFGTDGSNADNLIGSFHTPLTYRIAPRLQLHLTPGVSIFPDQLNGIAYYGTVASLGTGVTWAASERFQVFTQLNAPLSGGNTINSNREITKELVYTAGARYAFTPKVALEAYVTNGVGVTPASSILTFYPNGDEPLWGLRVLYTPGKNLNSTYRPTPLAVTTPRMMQLQQDAFTVGTAGILEPGTLRLLSSVGTSGNFAIGGAIALDRDFQVEGIIEDYSNDGSITTADDPTPNSARWMGGGRIRVMDQNNGNPFSLSLRVLGGRDTVERDYGVLYVAAPASYDIDNRLTFQAEPKFLAFGSNRIGGLGLGANFEFLDGLQLMGEVTPISDGRPLVWAVGARYYLDGAGMSVDFSATNSIGRYGLGTMIAQNDTRFSIGVTKSFNLRKFW